MATEAQIAANRANSTHSTGPRTPTGLANSSANATSFGLFTVQDFVAEGENDAHAAFIATWRNQLLPVGPIEETFAIEITRAAWRLRRCARVESELAPANQLDPMLDPASAPIQTAVDRAHLHAHNKLRRSITELRRIQTERQFRETTFPEDVDPELGLASARDLAKFFAAQARHQLTERRLNDLINMEAIVDATAPPANWVRSAQQQNNAGHMAESSGHMAESVII
jgi:hypothetical protein